MFILIVLRGIFNLSFIQLQYFFPWNRGTNGPSKKFRFRDPAFQGRSPKFWALWISVCDKMARNSPNNLVFVCVTFQKKQQLDWDVCCFHCFPKFCWFLTPFQVMWLLFETVHLNLSCHLFSSRQDCTTQDVRYRSSTRCHHIQCSDQFMWNLVVFFFGVFFLVGGVGLSPFHRCHGFWDDQIAKYNGK